MVSASRRKKAVRYLLDRYLISERRACSLCCVSRKVFRYKSVRDDQEALRQRIREIAHSRIRYGYKRVHILLKREGIHVNKKRVHRLYCEEGLQLRPKRPRRHVSAARREPKAATKVQQPNEAWSMDFVTDQLHAGKHFRILTVVDVFTRECLVAHAGQRLGGDDVVLALNRVLRTRKPPKRIYCDNGSEFTGRFVDLWAYHNKVELAFSRPGKPTDNAYIESFNGSFRDECLNIHWFSTIGEARSKIEAWRQEYNESRPHRALNGLAPLQFKAQCAA